MYSVNNREAADILFNVATILELAEDNPYRVRAYRRAARLLLGNPLEAKLLLSAKKELELPGLGPRLRRKLGELLTTGRMGFYVELCSELPPDLVRLMQLPGIGPKLARRLNEELGLSTAKDVYDAAQQGKIRELYGFGPKRERRLLEGAQEVLAGRLKTYAPIPGDEADEDEKDAREPLDFPHLVVPVAAPADLQAA